MAHMQVGVVVNEGVSSFDAGSGRLPMECADMTPSSEHFWAALLILSLAHSVVKNLVLNTPHRNA